MRNTSLLFTALALALFGCAKANDNAESSIAPAVPSAWIAPEPSAVKAEPPSEELSKSIQSAVQAHVEALDSVSSARSETKAVTSLPSDYTPWHLDGMIGAFSVDVGGVFGTLVADGAAGVKVTWQQKAVAAPQALPKTPPKTAVHFRQGMTAKDVNLMLAPVVRMAKQTKSVRNADALRRNLNRQGQKFLSMVRVLSTTPELSGWHIDGFQLGLFFNAAGNVTPVIGLSGTMNVYFDWQVIPGQLAREPISLTSAERKIQKSMVSFVRTVSEILPAATAAASDIRKSGFEFQVFQIGLGIGVGGNIGIASAQASAVGRIIFKKDKNESATASIRNAKIPVFRALKDGTAALYQAEAAKFKEGISRAVEMGNYFAVNASAMDSARWKCTEIELGFDTALSGDLALVTVTGIGLVRMGFERLD